MEILLSIVYMVNTFDSSYIKHIHVLLKQICVFFKLYSVLSFLILRYVLQDVSQNVSQTVWHALCLKMRIDLRLSQYY